MILPNYNKIKYVKHNSFSLSVNSIKKKEKKIN